MGELESRGYLDEERGNKDPYLSGAAWIPLSAGCLLATLPWFSLLMRHPVQMQ